MIEEKYSLSERVHVDLMMFGDWNAVAKDLENMAVGQICDVRGIDVGGPITTYDSDTTRIEECKSDLIEALGDRRENYELTIVFGYDKRIGNICFKLYATLRVTREK